MTPITTTAQSLAVLGGTDWLGIVHLLPGLMLSALLAWLLATPVQAAIETAIAAALPVWAFPVKALLPTIFSAAIGYLAHALGGLSGVDAVTGAVVLAQATHWANEQPWAVELEGKFPKVWAWIGKGVSPTAKMVMLCGLLLGLGAGLSADTTTTARGFMATPSLLAQGALYQLNTDGTLTPTAESVAGMQYSFYWGTYTESTEGKINFEPLVFITPFSIGVSTGTGSTRPVYSVAVGYKYFGVSAAWNLGANQERPLVGLMANIPLDPLLNGLVWDISGTAAKYFPGASF